MSDWAVMLKRCANGMAPGSAAAMPAAATDARGGSGWPRSIHAMSAIRKQRHEIEEVPLLDALRVLRGEDADLERQPDGERRRRGGIHAQRAIEMPRIRDEHDERREREHEDGEIELRDVKDDPFDRRPDVIPAVRGDAVVAEDRGRRMAARDFHDDDEHRCAADDPVQRRERLEPLRATALDPCEDDRRGEDGGDDRDRLCARDERERARGK